MDEIKKKLENIEAYKADTTAFKAQLKTQLLTEYRAQKNAANAQEVSSSSFGWFKLFTVPVMAMLVLGVFVAYEYVNKPMTAYAYLKEVKKQYDVIETQGVSMTTMHRINGEEVRVTSTKDKEGDLLITVEKKGVIVENFVLDNGEIFVADTPKRSRYVELGYEEEVVTSQKIEDLTSIINSIVLTESANPFTEFEQLMSRDDLNISQDGDVVSISYEEDKDGEIIVSEHQFKDFKPVKRRTFAKYDDSVKSIASIKDVEEIEYLAFTPSSVDVEVELEDKEYVPFIKNENFKRQIEVAIADNLDGLVVEYENLEDKKSYIAIWDERPPVLALNPTPREIKPREIAISVPEEEVRVLAAEPNLDIKVRDSVQVKEPEARVIDIKMPTEPRQIVVETKLPQLSDRSIDIPVIKPVERDINISEPPKRIVFVPEMSAPRSVEYEEAIDSNYVLPKQSNVPHVAKEPFVRIAAPPAVVSAPRVESIVKTAPTFKAAPSMEDVQIEVTPPAAIVRDSLVKEIANDLNEAEAKKRAIEEANRKKLEEERKQKLEEDKKRLEQDNLDEAAKKRLQSEIEAKKRAIEEEEKKKLEEAKKRQLEEERKRLEQEAYRLKNEQAVLDAAKKRAALQEKAITQPIIKEADIPTLQNKMIEIKPTLVPRTYDFD